MFALRNLARSFYQYQAVPRVCLPTHHLYSSGPGQKFIVRRAELRDKEKVVALGSEVQSVDRLPTYYERFIKDPQRHCYVLERWGELVAYSHAHVVDGGYTLAFHDVRLGSQEDDDRDNFRFLLTYSTIKEVQDAHPNLENATVVLSEERDSLANLDAVYKVVGKQKYHAIKIPSGDFQTVKDNLDKSQTDTRGQRSKQPAPSHLTPSEAVNVATRVSGMNSFFGGDRIILMGESYQPTQENFVNARGLFKHILATFGFKKELLALSFRNSFTHAGSDIQTLDIFTNDKLLFLDHFRSQLRETLTMGEEALQFIVQVPSVMSKTEFSELCVSNFGVSENDISPVCDYVLGEIPCEEFQRAAAAHLASE